MVGRHIDPAEQRRRFGELISAELYARLWRQAVWLTSSREDAQDLLQDTLTRAYTSLAQLRDETRAAPWLMSIMRRLFLNRVRGNRRRQQHQEWLAADERTARGRGEGNSLVEDALFRLRPADRWLLTMHYIEDVPVPELSVALRVNDVAVRKRLSRARRALKNWIEKLQGGDDAQVRKGSEDR